MDTRTERMDNHKVQPIGDIDLHLFAEGNHHQIWQLLGAHQGEIDGVAGCRFAV